jgi:transcriptional regulator with XRE-family HTH domain
MDVKSVIRKKGYTFEQVAEKMGITRITLTQNLGRNPTVNTLQRVADAIGCKVGDFFVDEVSDEEGSSTIICPKCGAKFGLVEKE